MDINEILNWVRQRLREEPETHSHDERMVSLGREAAFNEVYTYFSKVWDKPDVLDSDYKAPESEGYTTPDDWVSIDDPDVGRIADQM